MAVPSLPSNLAAGDVLPEAWVDDVRLLQQFWRDTRPVLAVGSDTTQSLTSGVLTTASISDSAGAFVNTPAVNVGGFTASATTGDVVVPETGVYRIGVSGAFATSSTGRRRIAATRNTATVPGSIAMSTAVTSDYTYLTAVAIAYFAASDKAGVLLYQTAGTALVGYCNFTMEWIGSSTT